MRSGTDAPPATARRSGHAAALVLVLLAAPVAAQQPSFSTLKEDLRVALERGDAEERRDAVEALARHARPETVRHLLDVIRDVNRELARARHEWAELTRRRAELRREVNRIRGLVKRDKLGERKLARAKAELDAVSRRCKELSGTIDGHAGIEATLRKAVGWAVQRCSERHRRDAAHIIRSAWRSATTPEEKADVLRVVVWVDLDDLRDLLEDALASDEPPVRVGALRAVEERGGRRALRLAVRGLDDPAWQVRAQAIRVLREVGGADAARALIGALEEEDGRLVTDAIAALREITGRNFHDNVHLWRDWLAENGASLPEPTETENAPPVEVPEAVKEKQRKRAEHGTGFYGIDSRTKRPVYVIDFSGSMRGALSGKKGEGGGGGPARIGGPRKVDGVVTQLVRAVEALPGDALFNVVLFQTRVTVWRGGMQPATRENKEALRAWVLERRPGGATNLFGGLEEAFRFAGRGSFDRHYGTAVDTIFLLSDGSPTAGRIQDPAHIAREIGALNDLKRVAIHCIGLGRRINGKFLRRLAEENDGAFVHVTR